MKNFTPLAFVAMMTMACVSLLPVQAAVLYEIVDYSGE